MRCSVEAAVRSAFGIESPPVCMASIHARVRARANRAPIARARAPFAVIAAMVAIGFLTFVMIDRVFMAPATSGSAVSTPMPSPTMT